MGSKATKAALASFIETRSGSGELVDVYESPWIKKAFRQLDPPAGLSKHRDFVQAYGSKLSGAYLALALDPYRRETLSLLPKAFPITAKVINQKSTLSGLTLHNPDFIFFNTRTGQALALGLGRKNRDFMFALAEGAQPEPRIRSVSDFLEARSAYKRRFMALDKAGAITYLLERFQDASAGWAEWGTLPISGQEAATLLASRPQGRVYRNEWGEEYSRHDLLQIRRAEAAAEKLIDRGEAPFRALFSHCKCLSWELNTGDN